MKSGPLWHTEPRDTPSTRNYHLLKSTRSIRFIDKKIYMKSIDTYREIKSIESNNTAQTSIILGCAHL